MSTLRVMRSSYPSDMKPNQPRKDFNGWALFIKRQLMKMEYPKLKGGRK